MSRPSVDASASSATFVAPVPAARLDLDVGRLCHDRTIPGNEPRLLAARLLERTLLRLGRAGTVVERRLAPGLSKLHGRRLYRLLGYVRLADYLTERLGMSLRRCQSILRLERALADLPRLAQALAAGEVSVSKVEVAVSGATPESEGAWIERAKRLPLAELREAARQARLGGEGTDGSSMDAAPASFAASALPIEQDEPGRLVSFTAPASVLAIWHWTLDLVRRVAGQQEPAWRCAEFLAAEFLAGVPDTAGDPPPALLTSVPSRSEVAPDAPDRPASAPNRPAGGALGQAAWIEASDAVREALASIGASADPEAILSERPVAGEREDPGAAEPGAAEPDDELDAWELDAHLRRLVRLRQSLAWRQGRLLATFASLRLHRDLGFDTFDDWVGDRLAMSPRRARYLVSLVRRLRDLPLLADAYRRGLVSWCQARLLVRVVQPATQSRWIRYARQVTVRRLEDVVIDCEVAAAESSTMCAPSGAAHIGAAPLPPTEPSPAAIASVPREEAHRHTSAPPLDLGAINLTRSDRQAWRRISFWCPLDVASLWDSALRACRAAAGEHLDDWECFLLFVQALRDTWESQEDPHWRRRYRILERDGWRCKTPGCTSRSGLNAHHIIFRSHQGDNDEGNLVTLCVGHHQQGLHEGRIRCFGKAPDGLWWDLGVKAGGDPLARYFGERLVRRRPFVPLVSLMRDGATLPRVVSSFAGAASRARDL